MYVHSPPCPKPTKPLDKPKFFRQKGLYNTITASATHESLGCTDMDTKSGKISQKLKKTRRGHKRTNKKGFHGNNLQKCSKFTLVGTNSNCLTMKKESLFYLFEVFQPSAVLIQETMLQRKGQISIPGYQIFEKVRENMGGGGLLTAISSNYAPVLISNVECVSEILTVQIYISDTKIRIINAYGPQENIHQNKNGILQFWIDLENEIINAFENNCMIMIEMDANAKVDIEYNSE